MKTSKKSILCMLAAIVLSMGVMNSVPINNNSDSNLNQIGVVCVVKSVTAESAGATAAWGAGGAIAIGTGIEMIGSTAAVAAKASALTSWSPLGWGLAITAVLL
jgi:hypothetical protein